MQLDKFLAQVHMALSMFKPIDAAVRYAVDSPHVLKTCAAHGITPLPRDFPFLVSQGGRVVEPVLGFMAARFIVRELPRRPVRLRHSPSTREAAIRDLSHFFDFLDALRTELADVSENVVETYAGSMLRKSSTTGKPYAFLTVQRRMSTVRAFVLWLQDQGRLRNRFDVRGAQTSQSGLYRRTTSRSLSGGSLAGEGETSTVVDVMTPDEARLVLASLGPLPSSSGPTESSRDRLPAEIALNTGPLSCHFCSIVEAVSEVICT